MNQILANIVSAKTQQAQLKTEHLNYAGIASNTEGYLPADLRDLVDRAIHLAAKRSFASRLESIELTGDDFSGAQAEFVPLSLRDVKLQKSEVQWSDIGGLQETRKILRETLEWPTKYGPIFASCPLRLRSGSVTPSDTLCRGPSDGVGQTFAVWVSWMWQNFACKRCRQRMWPQLYLYQRTRDSQQVYRCE